MEQKTSAPASTLEGPLVSIVIPTYNRAHMLPRALDACLRQTYRNIEVVIVNDGSSDGTREVLEKYGAADPRVRAFNKENEGIGHTLNYGFERTKGSFVTWTSDDNYYYPEAIERMAGYLMNNPEISLVYTDVRNIDADGRPLGIYRAAPPDEMMNCCVVRGCLLYTREVMEKVGLYNNDWTRCQDYDYYIRIYKQFRVDHIPEVLYDYCEHEASMSGSHTTHVFEEARLLSSYAESIAERRKIWGTHMAECARWERNCGRKWRSVGFLFLDSFLCPSKIKLFINALWRTSYVSLPEYIKNIWRRLKRKSV